MNPQYYELCDQLDAAVFSGEMVCDSANRQEFKEFLARWTRAVSEAESHD